MSYTVKGNRIVIEIIHGVDSFPYPMAQRTHEKGEMIKLKRVGDNEFELLNVGTSLDGVDVDFFPNWDPGSIQYGKR